MDQSTQLADLLKRIDDLSQEVKLLKCSKVQSQKERLNFPKRIILIRHGESEGNADESIYSTQPDWKVPLTEQGYQQALDAGKSIKELIGNEPISIYCSPYIRTKQTLHGIISQLEGNQIVNAREEPRLTGTYSLNILT